MSTWSDSASSDEDVEALIGDATEAEPGYEPLPENIYSFVMVTCIFATSRLEKPTHMRRISLAIPLYMCMLGTQFFLVYSTKMLVSPKSVGQVRDLYDMYETAMYTDAAGVSHTTSVGGGAAFVRGVEGFFNATNLEKLTSSQRGDVCAISFSQPVFLTIIIGIWTMTVLTHLRVIWTTSATILAVPKLSKEECIEVDPATGVYQVKGLAFRVKFAIIFLVQLPRFLLSMYLLWLGSRWLVSTSGFDNILLNAMALEFILNMAELFYSATLPYSFKCMVVRTQMEHATGKGSAKGFISGITCIAIVGYTFLYVMKLQQVLPDYKWDLAEPCQAMRAAQLLRGGEA